MSLPKFWSARQRRRRHNRHWANLQGTGHEFPANGPETPELADWTSVRCQIAKGDTREPPTPEKAGRHALASQRRSSPASSTLLRLLLVHEIEQPFILSNFASATTGPLTLRRLSFFSAHYLFGSALDPVLTFDLSRNETKPNRSEDREYLGFIGEHLLGIHNQGHRCLGLLR